MEKDSNNEHQTPVPARIIGGVFGFVFFGVGVSVLIFLWSAPFGEFGSPPLFFRVMGSFIAIAFVAFGGTFAFAAIKGFPPGGAIGRRLAQRQRSGKRKYDCPRCGATLGSDAEVSPSGDVKCDHCDAWFNIHSQ